MNEQASKSEIPAKKTQQVTFRMSSTLFIFDVIILVVAAGLFVLSNNVAIIMTVLMITILLLILLLIRFVFTSVTVGENNIVYRKGWLNTSSTQISYDKINTGDTFVSLWGRLLGFGTVKIYSGNDVEGIWFRGMEKPRLLFKMIEDRVTEIEQAEESGKQSAISTADEIAKLDKLRDEGIITDEEFEAKKKQLLNQ